MNIDAGVVFLFSFLLIFFFFFVFYPSSFCALLSASLYLGRTVRTFVRLCQSDHAKSSWSWLLGAFVVSIGTCCTIIAASIVYHRSVASRRAEDKPTTDVYILKPTVALKRIDPKRKFGKSMTCTV